MTSDGFPTPFRDLLESLPDGVIVASTDGRIVALELDRYAR